MIQGPLHLMLDSLAIGIVAATLLLDAILILDPAGKGAVLADLGPIVLTLIWVHFSVMAALLSAMVLLARDAD